MQFLLVHSPLVGPGTWTPVAAALRTAGHDVTVPDLRPAATTGRPDAVIAAAARAMPTEWAPPVLVAHSGAGALLPSIADELGEGPLVFVDAGVPPCAGDTTASADFLDRLRELAVDGVLPRWSTWWGSDVMTSLVPDDERRAGIAEEMPSVPLAFYETPIRIPDRWCDTAPGAYLLLSEGYRDDANRAQELGWPTVDRPGGHLDIVNHPEDVATLIVELAGLAA